MGSSSVFRQQSQISQVGFSPVGDSGHLATVALAVAGHLVLLDDPAQLGRPGGPGSLEAGGSLLTPLLDLAGFLDGPVVPAHRRRQVVVVDHAVRRVLGDEALVPGLSQVVQGGDGHVPEPGGVVQSGSVARWGRWWWGLQQLFVDPSPAGNGRLGRRADRHRRL